MNYEKYLIGVDLGETRDYTATVVLGCGRELQVEEEDRYGRPEDAVYVWSYGVRLAERMPLHTKYPAVIRKIETLVQHQELFSRSTLIIDATGVGKPIVEQFIEENLCPTIGIVITGGQTVTRDKSGRFFHVPKTFLVSALSVLVGAERLQISSELEHATILKQELLNFRVKTDQRTGHESFEAWRENQHDDLVLALSLCAWYATRHDKKTRAMGPYTWPASSDYDPRTWEMV